MWDSFNKYKANTFLNPHVSLWQKLLLFNITVVPNATYGCCAWAYEAKQLQKLEGTQIKMLKLIMNQQNDKSFNMIKAIDIADNHHWHNLLPIGARVESMHIKYLRHLLTTVTPYTQLHIICRCRITTNTHISQYQLSNLDTTTTILPPIPYASVIHRTITYYHLDELLQLGMIDGKHTIACFVAKTNNQPKPPEPEQPSPPYIPWYETICDQYFTKNNLTNLIKAQGHAIFLTHWKHHQILQRVCNHLQSPDNDPNSPQPTDIDYMTNYTMDDTISDISSLSDDGSDYDGFDDDNIPHILLDTTQYSSVPDKNDSIITTTDKDINTTQHQSAIVQPPKPISTAIHNTLLSNWPPATTNPETVTSYLESAYTGNQTYISDPNKHSALLDWHPDTNTHEAIITFLENNWQHISSTHIQSKRPHLHHPQQQPPPPHRQHQHQQRHEEKYGKPAIPITTSLYNQRTQARKKRKRNQNVPN
jgi:hypothetical protein